MFLSRDEVGIELVSFPSTKLPASNFRPSNLWIFLLFNACTSTRASFKCFAREANLEKLG